MAVLFTGSEHDTPGYVDNQRDYDKIYQASQVAAEAVLKEDLALLGKAVGLSYDVQMGEGMLPLPEAAGCLGRKYCGGGFGGYAVYLFESLEARNMFCETVPETQAIEPLVRYHS